jgi:hypothetical protein
MESGPAICWNMRNMSSRMRTDSELVSQMEVVVAMPS